MSKPRILITGGHMTPALAVISELQKQGDFEFVWVGHKHNQSGNRNVSAEYKTITGMGMKFVNLPAGKLSRNWGDGGWVAGLINLLKIPYGFLISLIIMLRRRPNIVISFGGYLALPIAITGRLFGKKVLTHEQTAVTGLTNKIIPKFAHKILISWPGSAKYYPESKTVLTGNPIRPEIFEPTSNNYDLNDNLPTIYITGGNQGSHKINQAIFPVLEDLLRVANVIHQTGDSTVTGDLDQATALAEQLADKPGKYYPKAYIFGDEIGEVFLKTALVIARSGANTVYEVLALGKPAIFVPIPWVTHNEQHINATIAANTGIAQILEEKDLTPGSLMHSALSALQMVGHNRAFNNQSLDSAKEAASSIVKFDAAKLIVKEVLHCLRNI